jgi:hypothetical protein
MRSRRRRRHRRQPADQHPLACHRRRWACRRHHGSRPNCIFVRIHIRIRVALSTLIRALIDIVDAAIAMLVRYRAETRLHSFLAAALVTGGRAAVARLLGALRGRIGQLLFGVFARVCAA